MTTRTATFLLPTLAVVALFALSAGVASRLLPRWEDDAEFVARGGLAAEDLDNLDLARVELPRPSLSPTEVVELQLAGLADPSPDGVGILQCYCFASPGNKIVTGPLERFGQMVLGGDYQCLSRPRATLVGQSLVRADVARVLVTVLDENWQVRAFTFVLSKQKEGPCRDCWMTDAVMASLPAGGDEPPPPEFPPENAI
jgi:hypothetical protein